MRRQKEHQTKIAGIKKGDQVVTAGGLLGKVVKVDDHYAELELAQGVRVKAVKSTIGDVVPPGGTAPAKAFADYMKVAVANRPIEQFETQVTLPEWQLEPDEESYFGQPDDGVTAVDAVLTSVSPGAHFLYLGAILTAAVPLAPLAAAAAVRHGVEG